MDIASLYASGMSLTEISRRTGIPVSTVRSRLVASGVSLRTRAAGVRAAADKGLLSSRKGVKRKPFSEEWKRAISEGRARWSDANARGYRVTKSGYIELTRGPHKGRMQHVVLMEKKIGRRLHRGECVHHKNGDKQDNRLRNLELMTLSAHAAHHATENHHARERDRNGRFV